MYNVRISSDRSEAIQIGLTSPAVASVFSFQARSKKHAYDKINTKFTNQRY